MPYLNIILSLVCISCILNLHGSNQLIKRALLQHIDDSLCGCYSISLTNVASSANTHNEMCYTYSIKHNDTMDICRYNTASSILLGICDHDRPRFKPKKLQKSIQSIHPDHYNANVKRIPHSVLSLEIENDCASVNNEQFTLCMKNVNKLGITSNNVQYTLYDDNIITCSNLPNQIGLPCRSNTAPPNTQDISSKIENLDHDIVFIEDDHPCSMPSIPNKTLKPTPNPITPSISPTVSPIKKPTETPTPTPIDAPASTPTQEPIKPSTEAPTDAPTSTPTQEPTKPLTEAPTIEPSPAPTSIPTFIPTSRVPTHYPTVKPTLKPTINPTTLPLPPTLLPTYYIDPDAPTRDVCIIFDQSCAFSDIECGIYLDWIIHFITLLHKGFKPRLCVLGVSYGVQVFIDINNDESATQIIDIIREQHCGNTDTNLLDALEFAQFQFDTVHPHGDIQSIVVFNSCSSRDAYGWKNEDEICETFGTIHTVIDFYLINIQSMNTSRVGKTDFDPNTYLNCLMNDNMDHIFSITSTNSRNALQIIGNISDEIIYRKIDDAADVDAAFVNVIDVLSDDDMFKHKLIAFSDSTRNVFQWIFIITMFCIFLNVLCCTFCALRQSGSLDPCFGAVDRGIIYDDDGCYLSDNIIYEISDLSPVEESENSWDITHITDNESVHMMSFHDSSEDRTSSIFDYVDSFIDYDDTPPIPGSVDSLIDDIKLKECLRMKHLKNFHNFVNVDMDFNVKPILYNK